jgi:hypothetical protein
VHGARDGGRYEIALIPSSSSTRAAKMQPAGSYLYEPAGSIHTLHVPQTNREVTDVWFAIRGANLNLDEQGNVASVWDARFLIDVYLNLCREVGHPRPTVIGL